MKEKEKEARTAARAAAYIEELFRDRADGHDAGHTFRVYRNAMKIASRHEGCDTAVVSLAALLHDADDPKLFHTVDNANARRFLAEEKIGDDKADRICGVINAVSFSRNRDRKPDTLEAMIVQDADRLDALGAVGIARTFAYGGEKGRSMEDSVAHFHEKLLLLKDLMNTDEARAMAEERHAFLEAFLREYGKETGDRRVAVLPYDGSWERDFTLIRDEVLAALGPLAVRIEHVGSTSVSGLSAKPVIDIDAVIPDSSFLAEAVAALAKAGYRHEGDLGIRGREAFDYEGKEHLRKHHLYVCPQDSPELRRHTAFRDYLRTHPEAVKEYSRIKEEGALLFPDDIDGYIAYKAPFIERIYKELGL